MIREKQEQHFTVPSGFKLTISNLALVDKSDNDGKSKTVQVYFDKCTTNQKHGVLLASLRTRGVVQHALSCSFLHSEDKSNEPSHFRLRMECLNKRGQKRNSSGTTLDKFSSGVEVHIMGNVEPVQYSADDDDGNDSDDDGSTEMVTDEDHEHCHDGTCSQ